MDLNSLASIRRCAAEFIALNTPLHVLVNNAGIMALPNVSSNTAILYLVCNAGNAMHALADEMTMTALKSNCFFLNVPFCLQ